MKILLPLILTLSLNSFAKTYQKQADELVKNPKDFHSHKIELAGEIQKIKKVILARDNYYTFKLKLENGECVDIKYYSIVDLLQVNTFHCENGYWATLKGKFYARSSGKKGCLGKIVIKRKSPLICTEKKT